MADLNTMLNMSIEAYEKAVNDRRAAMAEVERLSKEIERQKKQIEGLEKDIENLQFENEGLGKKYKKTTK